MIESDTNGENRPSDAAPVEPVWPPAIERPFVRVPDVFSEFQRDSARYFWFHVLALPMPVGVGCREYFSTSLGWWHSPLYKSTLLGVCLVGFIGNLWRAWQGWQVKALRDEHEHRGR